jgi:hypothetical protein
MTEYENYRVEKPLAIAKEVGRGKLMQNIAAQSYMHPCHALG